MGLSPGGLSLARGGKLCRYRVLSGMRATQSEVGRSLSEGPVRRRMSCTSLAYWPHLFSDTMGFSCGARCRSVSRHFSMSVYLPVRPAGANAAVSEARRQGALPHRANARRGRAPQRRWGTERSRRAVLCRSPPSWARGLPATCSSREENPHGWRGSLQLSSGKPSPHSAAAEQASTGWSCEPEWSCPALRLLSPLVTEIKAVLIAKKYTKYTSLEEENNRKSSASFLQPHIKIRIWRQRLLLNSTISRKGNCDWPSLSSPFSALDQFRHWRKPSQAPAALQQLTGTRQRCWPDKPLRSRTRDCWERQKLPELGPSNLGSCTDSFTHNSSSRVPPGVPCLQEEAWVL